MRKQYLFTLAVAALSLAACKSEDDSKDLLESSEKELMKELMDELKEAKEERPSPAETANFFEIDVPENMDAMQDLNPDASAQYAYVAKVPGENGADSLVLEHYVLVMVETREEIAKYGGDEELDAMSYRNKALESFGQGLKDFTILTENPKVEKINGLNAVKNEMRGTIVIHSEEIHVYYQLAIVEGAHAFYQVLTWTIEEQQDRFKPKMESIINSFKEKESIG